MLPTQHPEGPYPLTPPPVHVMFSFRDSLLLRMSRQDKNFLLFHKGRTAAVRRGLSM